MSALGRGPFRAGCRWGGLQAGWAAGGVSLPCLALRLCGGRELQGFVGEQSVVLSGKAAGVSVSERSC